MALSYRVYNLDNTVQGGKGSNQYTDVIVREVKWKRNEPDYALLIGSDSLNEGDEICVTKYDKSSDTESVIFVGFIMNRVLKGGKYQYDAYGFENKFTDMYKTFNYINVSVENLLEDMFGFLRGKFYVNVYHDSDGAYSQALTIRGVFPVWDMIIGVVNALGWEMRVSHSLSYLDSTSNTYKIEVDIKPLSQYTPTDIKTSYFAKKCSDSYNAILRQINKDTSKLINQYLVSVSPTYVNNNETFSSWVDNGSYVSVKLSYRINTIRKAQWYDGSAWNDYSDSDYNIEGDGYTVDLVKESGMTEVRIFYKYKFTYWSRVNDYDSINIHGIKSKKIILDWTDSLVKAKQYAKNLLTVSAKPIVKGILKITDGTSVDVWDEIHLYHDIDCSSYYDVFISEMDFPSKFAKFQTVDLKYRVWDVDVDSRLKKLEKTEVGEESMIEMHYPTQANSFEVDLKPKRVLGFPMYQDSNGNVYWKINGSAIYDKDMGSPDWMWIKLDTDSNKSSVILKEVHYNSGQVYLPAGDYIESDLVGYFQYNLDALNNSSDADTIYRISRILIYVAGGSSLTKEIRIYFYVDSSGDRDLDIKLTDSTSDTPTLYDGTSSKMDLTLDYGSSSLGDISLWYDSSNGLMVGKYNGTSSQSIVVDNSASQYEFYISDCYYKEQSNTDGSVVDTDTNLCGVNKPNYITKMLYADLISSDEESNGNLFANLHLACVYLNSTDGGYYCRRMD